MAVNDGEIREPEEFGYDSIKKSLRTEWLGKGDSLVFFRRIDSTNEEAKRRAEKGAPHGTVIISDEQTAGKGRRGRSWSSPHGTITAMSYLLRPGIPVDRISMLTLVMALACLRAVETVAGVPAMIKWPNDIVIKGRKVSGILTEMVPEGEQVRYVVIGTGINVNQKEFPEEIAEKATSLFLETGQQISRSLITAECARQFEDCYGIFERDRDLKNLKDEYNSRCANNGNRVKVLDPKGEYLGVSEGITDSGRLIVRLPDGSISEVDSGEVSVRGIYGYV